MTLRPSFLAIAALGLLAIPTLALTHAGNSDPNAVHACVISGSNLVRIVGANGSCLPSETPIHWVARTTRADGPCFDNVNRYVNCGNGTVTDTVTGLIWLRDANCLGTADWPAANLVAAALKEGDGGLTDSSSAGDWRLPTPAEWRATLSRAVALGCYIDGPGGSEPSLTNDAGTGCLVVGSTVGPTSFLGFELGSSPLPFFWSNASDELLPLNALHGSLVLGGVFPAVKTFPIHVWPVRSGAR